MPDPTTIPEPPSLDDGGGPRPAAPASTVFEALQNRLPVLFAAAVVTGVSFAFVSTLLIGSRAETPAEILQRALVLLDEGPPGARSRDRIRILAERLEEAETTPGFAGAAEYLRGIVAFREAEADGELASDRQYARALELLRSAETRGTPAKRHPEWSYATGVSLYRLGAVAKARPHLEIALEEYAPGHVTAAILLTEAALEAKDAESTAELLDRNQALLDEESLDTKLRDRLLLQRSRLLLALDREAEADAVLDRVSPAAAEDRSAHVFRAQTLMARGRHEEAISLLADLVEGSLADRWQRDAGLLTARCLETVGDRDQALLHYVRLADAHEQTQAGLAARLRSAELLRKAGRAEEALDAYRRVLDRLDGGETFRNRWLSLEEFRGTLLGAWNEFVEDGAHADAIELASIVAPLMGKARAHELKARATRRWAEDLQDEYDAATQTRRRELEPALRARWRDTGDAFARLAHELRTTSEYGDALHDCADAYRRGRRLPKALEHVTKFVETRPRTRLPEALLERARLLADLRRFDEALEVLAELVESHPTTPAAYEAQFEIGRCRLERDEPVNAAAAWKAVLTGGVLSPSSDVWRRSLFALARLQHHRGQARLRSARAPELESEARAAALEEAFADLQAAIEGFHEYLARYEDADAAVEARYLLAQSLRLAAGKPRWELESAETENSRRELRSRTRQMLEEAVREYRELQRTLAPRADEDRLGEVQRGLLRNSYYDVGQAFFDLGEFEKSIVAYGAAANRYPNDARVLLCHVQMAVCYDRLGKPLEARSMLQQARLLLERLPDAAFRADTTSMSRGDWERWLEWASRRPDDDLPPATSTATAPAATSLSARSGRGLRHQPRVTT